MQAWIISTITPGIYINIWPAPKTLTSSCIRDLWQLRLPSKHVECISITRCIIYPYLVKFKDLLTKIYLSKGPCSKKQINPLKKTLTSSSNRNLWPRFSIQACEGHKYQRRIIHASSMKLGPVQYRLMAQI